MTLKLTRLGWNRFPKSLQSYNQTGSLGDFWGGFCSLKQENMGMLGFSASNIHVLQACSLHPPAKATSDTRAGILSHGCKDHWTLDSQNKQEVKNGMHTLMPVFHCSFLSKKMIQMKLCGRVFVLKQAHLCQRFFLSASTSGDFMCLFIERRRPGIVGS